MNANASQSLKNPDTVLDNLRDHVRRIDRFLSGTQQRDYDDAAQEVNELYHSLEDLKTIIDNKLGKAAGRWEGILVSAIQHNSAEGGYLFIFLLGGVIGYALAGGFS
jgi:hypothetical protein